MPGPFSFIWLIKTRIGVLSREEVNLYLSRATESSGGCQGTLWHSTALTLPAASTS